MAKTIPSGEEYKHYASLGMAAYRAPSLLQPHKVRQAIRDAHDGKIPPLQGYFLSIPSVPSSVFVAQIGADIVTIDWEHSSLDIATLTTMIHNIQFISEGRSAAVVRVPSHDHSLMAYALDAGASLMVPNVSTVAEARAVLSSAKFGVAEGGARSAPPSRLFMPGSNAVLDNTRTVWQNMNRQASLTIQVENETAVRNLDDILSAVGDQIDGVWLGSLDLRISMGMAEPWGVESEFVELVELYRETLRKYDVPSHGFCFPGQWEMGKGKAVMTCTGDVFGYVTQPPVLEEARKQYPKPEGVNVHGVRYGDVKMMAEREERNGS